jgi:spore maturation protein SpmA
MLNVVWLAMILIAVLVGGFSGRFDTMTEGAFSTAKSAVMEIALPLAGLMAVWLGMMRLAERAGLVQSLARALRPVMRRLFPDVPPDHPAMGAMVLNMSANMLGLGNAATPLGLRAMALLQKLNLNSAVASNSMVTFLAVNTASIQLIPTTAISILAVQGSRNASMIVVPAMIATAIGMTCGIAASRLLARLPVFSAKDAEGGADALVVETKLEEVAVETVSAPPLTRRGKLILSAFIGAFAFLFAMFAFPDAFAGWRAADALRAAAFQKALPHAVAPALATFPALMPTFALLIARADAPGSTLAMLQAIGVLAVPFLLAFFPLYAALRGVKVYEQFCEGAKEAFSTAQRIIPFLVGMLVGIRLLRDAGVVQFATDGLRPFFAAIGFPADLLTLAVMRPLSGSASLSIFVDLVRTHGADSLISRTAATIYGSTETTFYVLAVYFGSVGIRKTRHAVIAGLTADVISMASAIAVCRLLAAP